jgi:hypothetical protein
VILDDLRSEDGQGQVERSARVRWSDGEFRLTIRVPEAFAPESLDASPFLCVCLLPAMRRGEDVEVRGPVSPLLLGRCAQIADVYARWDSRLHRSSVRAEDLLESPARAPGVACFFSRGVDSMTSAAATRHAPLTHLIFCDRLEPRHSDSVRREEIELADKAAGLLGLPLVLVESNVRELTDPIVGDWEDMVGAGLSFIANALAGAVGHVVIPSTDGPLTVGPCGTSPMLDPLFSTEAVQIEHDALDTRVGKVARIVAEHPELLSLLKVCYDEDRPDNCGRCAKCTATLVALEAAGAREQATGFPGGVDLDYLAGQRLRDLVARVEYAQALPMLEARGSPDGLARVLGDVLERAAALDPEEIKLPDHTPGFRLRAAKERLSVAFPRTRRPRLWRRVRTSLR